MKTLAALAVGALVLGTTVPASARTTVTRVHGPLKILPHHKVKVCKVTYRHGERKKKCHYN